MTSITTALALEHCYEVRLGTLGIILGSFLEVSGLGVQYETYTYTEGGRNDFVYQHLGRASHSNLTLKHGMTSAPVLLDWVLRKPPFDQPQDVMLVFKTPGNRVLRTFGFVHAVPVSWTGPNASIGANAVATESVVIAHRGLTSGMGGGR